MNLSINLKGPTTFASLRLDSLTNLVPNFTLEAHDKGVNYSMSRSTCVLINLLTTGDGRSLEIWDYRTSPSDAYRLEPTLTYALERA